MNALAHILIACGCLSGIMGCMNGMEAEQCKKSQSAADHERPILYMSYTSMGERPAPSTPIHMAVYPSGRTYCRTESGIEHHGRIPTEQAHELAAEAMMDVRAFPHGGVPVQPAFIFTVTSGGDAWSCSFLADLLNDQSEQPGSDRADTQQVGRRWYNTMSKITGMGVPAPP